MCGFFHWYSAVVLITKLESNYMGIEYCLKIVVVVGAVQKLKIEKSPKNRLFLDFFFQ